MTTNSDIQQLNPGALVTLYTLDATAIGGDVARFHQHYEAEIVWQGNTFVAFPVEGEGFARTSDQQPTPRLRVANVKGQITALCQEFDDLVGATILRQRVFAKYLDAANWPPGPVLTPGGGDFVVAGLTGWTVVSGTVSAAGDGKLRMGQTGVTSAAHFELPTKAGVSYTITGVLDAGSSLVVRVGNTAGTTELLTAVFVAATTSNATFVGTGNPVYVYLSRNSTTTQTVVDSFYVRETNGNPNANPLEEMPVERWFIERKSVENSKYVEFELSSCLDFNGVLLPRRQIIANNCPFEYRGPGCAYIGPPVATAMDLPTSNPLLDRCGKRLGSCKLREWPDAVLNFGGFPAAGLVRQ